MISLPYRPAFLAIIFCCVSIIVPYCFADQSGALSVVPVLPVGLHLLLALPLSGLLLGAFLFGWPAGMRPRVETLRIDSHPAYRLAVAVAYLTLAAQAMLITLGIQGYLQGGILAARNLAAIDGIGVIVRLSFVATCVLCVFEGRERTVRRVLLALVVLSLARSIVFSERTAILELVVTGLVVMRRGAVRVNLLVALPLLVGGILLFAWIQDVRTSQFDASKALDSGSALETAFRVYSSYYGDVQNKFYLIAGDVLRYPMIWMAEPFYRLVGEPFPNMNVLLTTWQNSTSYINSSLNNSGGLAQDVSDLGLLIGLTWAAVKMFMCAHVIVRSRTSVVALALAPIAYLQVIEYPRFNYIEQTYGFYLVVAAILLAYLVRRRPSRATLAAKVEEVTR